LVFCRVGSALLLLPALSEIYVPMQVRLLFGILLSINITPQLPIDVEQLLASELGLFLYLAAELTVGLTIGLICNIALAALHTLGGIIAMQSGLGAASLFDANQGSQSTVFGAFLSISAIVVMLSLDIHAAMFQALSESYESLPIGAWANYYDQLIDGVIKTVNTAFNTAVKMSAPFIVVISLLFLAAGVLSRLMPQLQIFFVMLPVQILISFLLLAGLPSLLLWFAGHYSKILQMF
jgi:flagellar biosynthetic protein FliR